MIQLKNLSYMSTETICHLIVKSISYAIHGNNPDIIHILEENHVKPSDKSFKKCLKESIKCHHNEISRYIKNNLMNERIEINERNFKNNSILYGFHYHNYEFIKDSKKLEDLKFILFYACLYDHFPIVELLIKTKKIDVNQAIIH